MKPIQFVTPEGRLHEFTSPVVMGILNLTDDSFYPDSRIKNDQQLLDRVELMLSSGCHILDIGAASSRPGADYVDPQQELDRILRAVQLVKSKFPATLVSVDTWRTDVARKAIEAGASIINDISAGSMDEGYLEMVAETRAPYILMHMKGQPKTMQNEPMYQDVALEVLDFFIDKIRILRQLGINDIWMDPGFGFGKTIEQNFQLLNQLSRLQIIDLPILVGVSRKSMIYKTLGLEAADALNGTTALHMAALMRGASVLRVHDVHEAVEAIRLWEALKASDYNEA